MEAILALFKQVFLRPPLKQELVVLQRLFSAYGQAVVCSAIRASIIIEGNSPINYIAKVCESMYNDSPTATNAFLALQQETARKLKELERYETTG